MWQINNYELASVAAGNWKSWISFVWHDCPSDGDLWTIVYTHNRDSNLLEKSNAKYINREMVKFEDDVMEEHHGHFAVGWVDGFAIRVWKDDSKREVTEAFLKWLKISEMICDRYILDEEDYQESMDKETVDNVRSIGRIHVSGSGDEWVYKVLNWLTENNPSALESYDYNGAYPKEEDVIEALDELGELCFDDE